MSYVKVWRHLKNPQLIFFKDILNRIKRGKERRRWEVKFSDVWDSMVDWKVLQKKKYYISHKTW